MNNPDAPGKLLDELHVKFEAAHTQGRLVWEEKLKLYLRPKPPWCPPGLWWKLVSLVLVQTVENHFR